MQIGGMSTRLSRLYGRASGMPLLIGLLVVTFAIAADLAHEAWATARSQQRAAERAAREFVHLAATSAAYEAQATTNLGLRTLFTSVASREDDTSDAPPQPDVLVRIADRIRDCRCAPLFQPSYYFRLALDSGALRLTANAAPTDAERRWLRDTLSTHIRAVRRPDWDVALLYGGVDSRPRIVAYTLRFAAGQARYAYGFVSDVAAFGDDVVDLGEAVF